MNEFAHVIYLPLTQGLYAKVDADAPEEIWGVNWTAHKKGNKIYAFRTFKTSGAKNKTHLVLHHAVLGVPAGRGEVDHENGDTMDNRRDNLRFCKHSQNGKNLKKWKTPTSSSYKGVSLRSDGSWRAYITLDARQKHLGTFDCEVSAARAYNIAAKELFGEFARLNPV